MHGNFRSLIVLVLVFASSVAPARIWYQCTMMQTTDTKPCCCCVAEQIPGCCANKTETATAESDQAACVQSESETALSTSVCCLRVFQSTMPPSANRVETAGRAGDLSSAGADVPCVTPVVPIVTLTEVNRLVQSTSAPPFTCPIFIAIGSLRC